VVPRAGLDGRKISSPSGFDPTTFQPIAQSLYRLSYRARKYEVILLFVYVYIISMTGNIDGLHCRTNRLLSSFAFISSKKCT